MTDTIDRNTYGAIETNGLVNGAEYHAVKRDRHVDWTEPGLYITRLRLVSDPGFPMWDVSYCHGEIDGEPVTVHLPFYQIPKRGFGRFIVEQAIADGVHAKKMGIFDNMSRLQ